MKKKWGFKVLIATVLLLVVSLAMSVLLLPGSLFPDNYSTVVFSRGGELLGAKLANDAQWRFLPSDSVSRKFKTAIIAFEDQYFYAHPGINPVSVFNAIIDNIKAGKIKRGASTITMQIMRLSGEAKARTLKQKLLEGFFAFGLEARYSKDEILNLYCSNAPFGGNIVGVRAASWRYFGHPEHELSWAEAAVLAVLPNSPSLIHPGRNRDKLTAKRNRLLKKLLALGNIDSTQYQLAVLEVIPEKVKSIPSLIPHLMEYLAKTNRGELINTTIDYNLQLNVNQIASAHADNMLSNGINNVAVIVTEPARGEVLAYLGNNVSNHKHIIRDKYNDMVMAKRSSGSILKPFLYAAMNDAGLILPNSLVRDIPSYFNGYHPQNYTNEFQGAVTASLALSKSLNVPAVYMLQKYGVARFLRLLNKLGFSSFTRSPSNYGLSLILGGGELSLFELVNAYSGMAQTLIAYDRDYGDYPVNAYHGLKLILNNESKDQLTDNKALSAASIWLTYKALKNVNRPETELGWESFRSSNNIAWKTGTSHGFKDAWAVGTTANFVVGVWAGNSNGEGRNGLTGTTVAAPIMFDVFSVLENSKEFYPPYDELTEVLVCRQSGYLASQHCKETDLLSVGRKGAGARVCTYHRLIFTNDTEEFQLSQKCVAVSQLKAVSWFVLPPVQELYYKKKYPAYKTLPPFAKGCEPEAANNAIDIVYPVNNSTIYVVTDEGGKKKEVVFEVGYHYPSSNIYWHLDNTFMGITTNNHQLAFVPEAGKHTLTIVDENGESKSVQFEIIY